MKLTLASSVSKWAILGFPLVGDSTVWKRWWRKEWRLIVTKKIQWIRVQFKLPSIILKTNNKMTHSQNHLSLSSASHSFSIYFCALWVTGWFEHRAYSSANKHHWSARGKSVSSCICCFFVHSVFWRTVHVVSRCKWRVELKHARIHDSKELFGVPLPCVPGISAAASSVDGNS